MRCSIAMSTRNKSAALNRTLASIRRQNVPFEYEIIVADDGSTDDTREVCMRHGVRHLYLDNDRYRNPATARNDAYRAAAGDIIIAQSDDVLHYSENAVSALINALQPNAVAIATVLNMKADGTPCNDPFPVYSGPKQPRAFFFLGAMWRKDLYAFGGNHEGFIEPCWDDNWFQDCILTGQKLKLTYAADVIGHHQSHDFPRGSHDKADVSKRFYYDLRREADKTSDWTSPGAPWPEQWPTIPKRMSFFWGGEHLSWMRYMTLASFRHFHPDWEMRLYTTNSGKSPSWRSSEREDASQYRGPDYSDRLASLGVFVIPWECPVPDLSFTHASDVCEWDILASDGGFYADMDVLFVRPIDYDNICHADAVFCLSGGYMTIGFMGASAGNALFRIIHTEATQNIDKTRYQFTGAEAFYRFAGLGANWPSTQGPGRIVIDSIRKILPRLRVRTLNETDIYPWTYLELDRIFSSSSCVPKCCNAIHWFGASNISQEWNARLTEDNFREFDNTFTQYARKIYDCRRSST